ncbi:MAG: 2-oxo acid dehydrogenase subunit E2 [Anaerolineales bacterium]|nr:2-oxo acid dehydrogenase subunit E2 [Anaerolineales bacterium]
MPIQVIMPQLGESVLEGTISKWLVAEGEQVNEYDPLVEINTDKVDTEIPSPANGLLLKVLAVEGTIVQVGTNLAWIGELGEEIPDEGVFPDTVKTKRIDYETVVEISTENQTSKNKPPLSHTPGRHHEFGYISPVVAKIANEQNVDLSQVTSTGRGGRITKKDILAYLKTQRKETPPESLIHASDMQARTPSPPPEIKTPVISISSQGPTSPQPGEVVSLSPVRRAIAEHMVQSKRTSPHVTTIMEADMSQVVAHREINKVEFAHAGVKLTFTPYFVAAAVSALKSFPIVNSSWTDSGIQLHRDINIGMATSLGETGLIVPVIKKADALSLFGLASAVNDLANRARTKLLNPDEVQGGTFTITNHGISGSLLATPIINQPQCGILGIGAIQKRVIVIEDAIAIRPMAYFSLTFDHRILDGAIADYYLSKVVESLENLLS